jgi:hypothetical protein
MNAQDITFGCEFEVIFPAANAPRMGHYHSGIQVPQLPVGWKAERDSSLSASRGHVACEIVSPILQGADGIQQVLTVCKWLNEQGATVNGTTGFHVHVGFDRNDEDGLKRLVSVVANHEAGIYAATGTKSREQGGWCGSNRNDAASKAVAKNGVSSLTVAPSRYKILNLTNLLGGRRPAVEFRAFAGTTNASKALGYIQLAIGLVQRARTETCKRGFGRKYPASMHNGEASVKRLVKFLGWTTSKSVSYGHIETNGAPSLKDTVKELVRLAKKYDGRV